MRARALLTILAVAAAIAVVGPGHASVPSPEVTGPIGEAGLRHHALFDSPYDLTPIGYRDDEYFVSGTARNDDGDATAPYTTRIIVTRPIEERRFNGTVLLDWVNVTAQFENAVDSVEAREMLLRDGYAYVHASIQAAGICCTPLTPKVWDPVRYKSLSHPGDGYANDILSQIARAVRVPNGDDPFAGLSVERILAVGQSQSASKLYDYVNDVQPGASVIDGFLIHGGGSKTYQTPPAVPVLHLLSDAEASPTEPNTTENYRLWEIAGTSHSDFWIGYYQVFGQGPRTLADAGKRPVSDLEDLNRTAGIYGEQIHPLEPACVLAGGTMPMHYAVSTAIHRLNDWVRTGVAPPNGPRFAFTNGNLALDEHRNALGGIRLPPIDVPVATYVSTLCGLGGLTIPFTEVQLRLLYPTHADYYAKMKAATEASLAAGWLLPEDAADLLRRACAAKNRWGDLSGGPCA
ncbi:MAG: alpha/beta hydrolase domain-containing protein [Actinomycetota bacterium]